MPEALERITRFGLVRQGLLTPYDFESISWVDYQLLIIMTNAVGNKLKSGEGTADKNAVLLELDED